MRNFEMYRGKLVDPKMQKYHKSIQIYLLFFIEASSYIDDSDSLWEVILLFERVGKRRYFAGYTTLYNFMSFPSLKRRLRISQFLLLPPYQKQGHGKRILEQVHNIASSEDYIEVNVEDPSPGFQFMRDVFDARLCQRFGFFQPSRSAPTTMPKCLKKWDEKYGESVHMQVHITMVRHSIFFFFFF